MDASSQAREQIAKIIKARTGGVAGLAEATGLHFTRIYAFLRGSGLDPDNAGKLRAALPEVAPSLWADAFAPVPASVTPAEVAAP